MTKNMMLDFILFMNTYVVRVQEKERKRNTGYVCV